MNETNEFIEFVKAGIKARINEFAEDLIKEAKKRLEEEIPNIVSKVAIDLTQETSFEQTKNAMIFTIKKQQ